MVIKLSGVTFTNDMFYLAVRRNSTLLLNRVDEWLKSGEEETKVHRINIEIIDNTYNEKTRCPSIIGLSNKLMALHTEYSELEGQVLTEENMEKCTLEVYEEE